MASIGANGLQLEYEVHGSDNGVPMLLIMGLGAQLTMWPTPFVEALADRGYRVIRFDNRDCGLSTKLDDAGTPNIYRVALARMLGLAPRVPYTIADMAADAVGLLDALGIAQAHVVGASMGGMIAQHVAARHAERVLSLASIMSTTGNPRLPRPSRRALGVLLRRPRGNDVDAAVAHGMRVAGVIGSPGYPDDEDSVAARVRGFVTRMNYPPGITRQLAAILADGDRRAMLRTIRAPTVVVHGLADPLVHPAGGRDTARVIPGATLVEIEGMGHDIPFALVPRIAEVVDRVAAGRKS